MIETNISSPLSEVQTSFGLPSVTLLIVCIVLYMIHIWRSDAYPVAIMAVIVLWMVTSCVGFINSPDVIYDGEVSVLDFSGDQTGAFQLIVYSPTGMTTEADRINLTRATGRLYDSPSSVRVQKFSGVKWGIRFMEDKIRIKM